MNISIQHPMISKRLRRIQATLRHGLALNGLRADDMAKVRLAQAHICFWQGHIETAQTIAMETLESVQEQQHMQLLTQAQSILGSILSASGHYAEADEYFSQAIHTSQKFGLRLEYARALYSFGVALLQRNQPEDATLQQGLRYLHEAQNIFVECHAAIDLEKVKRIIAA